MHVRSWLVLHHNPFPTISIIIGALLRARARPLPILYLKCLLFHNLERERPTIGAFTAWIRRLVFARVPVRVRVGCGGKYGWKELCEERFASRKTAAYNADRGLDADDDEEDGAVPCSIVCQTSSDAI
jgi:hypothetical protein